MTPSGDGAIEFASEPGAESGGALAWKILIADDDRAVHAVMRLALADVTVGGRALEFRDAYGGGEACRILRDDIDIALVLMDLVMEGERSGIEAARAIRGPLGNARVRIVLCTGDIQTELRAGTMAELDLTECWQKTELTARRLSAIVHNALGRYGASAAPRQGSRRATTGTFPCMVPQPAA